MNSHDVRKIRICCLCQGLGIYKPGTSVVVPTVLCLHTGVPVKQRKYAHPRCYMEEMGTEKLLTLPQSELQHIRAVRCSD